MSDADYAAYFLNSSSAVVALELLEISHPDFTQTYRVVRNYVAGVTVTLENGQSGTFSYYPLKISAGKSDETLDAFLRIQLGDLGEILPIEMDAVAAADGFGTKPTVRYWVYRSDDLTTPLYGPLTLEITDFDFSREGCQFDAKAPSLNLNRTGEIYDLDRFPMLRLML